MLRRPPTTLHITAEDIAAYEDRRATEALALQHRQAQLKMQGVQQSPGRAGRRTRDERLGVNRR
ncbi:hypothetical protein UVI_02018510 [Ustilaginoidea virens]|uniref:Anaphase-promoting complex, subunit CDC26 n=1 Tax=Ustilaginoidea virens TaxID=1159556 RepID=A0A1B5KSA0_USTVR|nr:hypothetical protein UVI_02018510 [Ustilaginoidea virens]